jgi:FkbM family methyltransferase
VRPDPETNIGPLVNLEVPGVGPIALNTHETGDPYVSCWLQLGNLFEPAILDLLRAFIVPGCRMLDIGANIGWFTNIAPKLCGPAGRVYAFEPDPTNAAMLRGNLALNRAQNVRVIEAAAGARRSTMFLSRSATNQGDHQLAVQHIGPDITKVAVRRPDAVFGATRRISVIKIDTQGSEVNVF